MELLSFVIWTLGYPCVEYWTRSKDYFDIYSAGQRGFMALSHLVIWVSIAVLIWGKVK